MVGFSLLFSLVITSVSQNTWRDPEFKKKSAIAQTHKELSQQMELIYLKGIEIAKQQHFTLHLGQWRTACHTVRLRALVENEKTDETGAVHVTLSVDPEVALIEYASLRASHKNEAGLSKWNSEMRVFIKTVQANLSKLLEKK